MEGDRDIFVKRHTRNSPTGLEGPKGWGLAMADDPRVGSSTNVYLCQLFRSAYAWHALRTVTVGMGLPAGGVGCTPGRPSAIENDSAAACAQYLNALRNPPE